MLLNLPPHLKKVTEARHVSWVPLNGRLVERPLCEAVRLKSRLPWKTQDVRDARAVGNLLRKAAHREWNQPKRKKCAAVNKADCCWRSLERFDIRHEDTEFSFPNWFSILVWSNIFLLC